MPFSRISLLEGKSPAYLRALGDSLHAAMVEAFNVPPKDRFQIIHQHQPHELMFDREYEVDPSSPGRSDDFVIIAITTGKPRDAATKRAFYSRLTQRLQESPGIHPRDVMVVVTTAQGEDWSMSGGVPAASLTTANPP